MPNFNNDPIQAFGKPSRVQIFRGYVASAVNTVSPWYSWEKPKKASMVLFTCFGGGAGGGAGLTGASLSARGGGSGGGSGAAGRLLIPAFFLPRVLYVLPGCGGAGAASSGNTGVSGGISMVCDTPNTLTVNANRIAMSGRVAAVGGAPGTTAGSALGGAAEQAGYANNDTLMHNLGIASAVIGVTGAAGGALGAAGGSITYGATSGISFTSGAGGGSANASNTDGAGGNITGQGNVPTLSGGAAPGGAGAHGYHLENISQWLALGGAGGASSGASGTGGRGGNGSWCCGGGGGGGGVTGGAGGDGGPGIIIIAWW